MDIKRRKFIRDSGITAAGLAVLSNMPNAGFASDIFTEAEPFSLPQLPYVFSALEPHIDAQTMEIHYTKHHQAYVNNLNKAVAGTAMEKETLEDLMKTISKRPLAVRNNGGGHYNHSLFWSVMKPANEAAKRPGTNLMAGINSAFGSFEKFREIFDSSAKSVFGSGWVWLVVNNGKMEVGTTPNQDNPLMDLSAFKGTPVLGLDVWEHAYYLKYQNKRADYISAWWNLVDWDSVEARLKSVK